MTNGGARRARAGLVHPGPAEAPSGVLPRCYRLRATAALLPGGVRRTTRLRDQGTIGRAETDRARVCHGEPGSPRAEMIQVRLTYPLSDHPSRTGPGRVPGCMVAPRSRQPGAAVPAFALSHRDGLQFRHFAGCPVHLGACKPIRRDVSGQPSCACLKDHSWPARPRWADLTHPGYCSRPPSGGGDPRWSEAEAQDPHMPRCAWPGTWRRRITTDRDRRSPCTSPWQSDPAVSSGATQVLAVAQALPGARPIERGPATVVGMVALVRAPTLESAPCR